MLGPRLVGETNLDALAGADRGERLDLLGGPFLNAS
jgi:hypothetical protein